jgi:hypothetical protein
LAREGKGDSESEGHEAAPLQEGERHTHPQKKEGKKVGV